MYFMQLHNAWKSSTADDPHAQTLQPSEVEVKCFLMKESLYCNLFWDSAYIVLTKDAR